MPAESGVCEGRCELARALELAIHGATDDAVSDDSAQVLGIPLTDFLDGVSHVVRESQHQFDRSSIRHLNAPVAKSPAIPELAEP